MIHQSTPATVSVIIPTYNRAHLIVDALESALSQECIDLDIIVVDDGSTDNTHDVLAPYMARIRYVYQANNGASAARNTGINLARGEFIAFLDSDDVWEPNKLRLQVTYLQSHPRVDMVCTDFSAFAETGIISPSYISAMYPVISSRGRRFDQIFSESEIMVFDGEQLETFNGNIFDILLEGYFTLTSTVIMRRSALQECGLFDVTMRNCEDYDYYMRVAYSHTIGYIDMPTMRHRIGHVDRLSGDQFGSEGFGNWLKVAERVRRNYPDYVQAHRQSVTGAIAYRRYLLGRAYFMEGHFGSAAWWYVRSLLERPWQPKMYGRVAYACACAARAATTRGKAHRGEFPAQGSSPAI